MKLLYYLVKWRYLSQRKTASIYTFLLSFFGAHVSFESVGTAVDIGITSLIYCPAFLCHRTFGWTLAFHSYTQDRDNTPSSGDQPHP